MIENVKKWRIVVGIIISAFIALLVFFPKGEIRGGYLPGWESAMVIFLQTIISWFIIQIILQNKEIKRPFQKALLAIFLSIIFTILIQLFAVKVVDWQLLKFQRVTTFKQIVFITVLRGFLTSGFLFFIAYLLYISGEAERLKKEAEIIKKENLEARLLVLQQQINPHFLFNALNTLHSISPDREVKRYVVNFSNVFRYQFNSNLNALASLEDELDFANAYLHIMKERFEDGLSIKINIPERYFYRKIPAVTLQMLIENAIKHNIVSEEFPLKLNLYIENEMLVVSNNVQPKESLEPSTGIGLRNIDERYQLLSEKSIQINVDEAIFSVQLPLL